MATKKLEAGEKAKFDVGKIVPLGKGSPPDLGKLNVILNQPKVEKKPKDKPYIDLGEKSTCIICDKRYCICEKRQNGEWENHLLIKYPGNLPPKKTKSIMEDIIKSKTRGSILRLWILTTMIVLPVSFMLSFILHPYFVLIVSFGTQTLFFVKELKRFKP